jgi:hypothetical protein
MKKASVVCSVVALVVLAFASAPALAGLTPYDVPAISCGDATLATITLNVCGGASGAPAGLTIQWKTKADYIASGWSDDGTLCALSLSGQPSLQHPGASRWDLGPGECTTIAIGDINFDETGVSGTCVDPLDCGTTYVFRWFAHAGRGFGRSDWGGDLECSTLPCPPPGDRCTYTQGYWKNHGGPAGCDGAPVNPPDVPWPASVLSGGMDLGLVHYSADQLCAIFDVAAAGNGLISLAHQLIAARLNLANNGTACSDLTAAIAAADALIGNLVVPPVGGGSLAPGTTSALTGVLTSYNEGTLCGPHCGGGLKSGASPESATPAKPSTWGQLKVRYR